MSTPRYSWVYHLFFWLVLAALLALVYNLLRPFFNAIFLAVILASLVHPLQRRFIALLRGRKTLAALLMTGLLTLCLIVPLVLVGMAVVREGAGEIRKLDEWLQMERWEELSQRPIIRQSVDWTQDTLRALGVEWEDFRNRLMEQGQGMATSALQTGAGLVQNITRVLSLFPVMLFVLFFLLRDGERYAGHVKELVPLHEEQKNTLFTRAKEMFRAVFVGTLLTAVLQGVVGGVGLLLAGFSPFLWGALVACSSFIPVLGTGLIFGPLTVWLLVTGEFWRALLLGGWALLFVSPIDNYVRPFLMPNEARLTALYLFLAIIGGVLLFGLPGLIYGPLIFGLTAVMLESYRNEYLQANAVGE